MPRRALIFAHCSPELMLQTPCDASCRSAKPLPLMIPKVRLNSVAGLWGVEALKTLSRHDQIHSGKARTGPSVCGGLVSSAGMSLASKIYVSNIRLGGEGLAKRRLQAADLHDSRAGATLLQLLGAAVSTAILAFSTPLLHDAFSDPGVYALCSRPQDLHLLPQLWKARPACSAARHRVTPQNLHKGKHGNHTPDLLATTLCPW